MDGNWNAAGADAPPNGSGWVSTSRTYDWKGRPLVTTNPDSTTTQLSYGGCGCAGGEVVTSRDERGRQKKLYHDALGRMTKVEELNYDSTVYSTGVYAYNARDQITSIRQYKGADTSGTYQERAFGYDGHGRLNSRTTPEQGACSYSYNADDTLWVMTDARGATQTYQYTARRLPYSISYGAPTGVAATPTVGFAYDAAGDRTQMTDGLGSVSYSYDSMSRMTQESRTLTGIGTFSLTYGYNNAGLASITGPTQYGSPQVSYTVDHTGAATSVNGSGPTSAPVYAQNIQYRASGGLKSEAYGNGRSLSVTYDNRQRVKRWDIPGVMGWDYSYTDFGENTGRVTYAQNLYDSTLSRSYDYDSDGRLLNSYTGTEALAHTGRGGAWGVYDGPYSQAYIKDEWGTSRRRWGGRETPTSSQLLTLTIVATASPTTLRVTSPSTEGRPSPTTRRGKQVTATYGGYSLQNAYDGDRQRVRKSENGVVTYYVRSSVLGGRVIVESNSAGGWYRGYVYDSGGGLIGIQANGVVMWAYEEPATKSQRLSDASGNVTAALDLDSWGLETSRSWDSQQQTYRYTTYERDGNQSDDATARRYNRWHLRFDQPDPYDGSYDLSDPQSLNRYSYVNDDPVNLIDPSGQLPVAPSSTVDASLGWWYFGEGFWGYSEGGLRTRALGHSIYSPELERNIWWGGVFLWEAWEGQDLDKPLLQVIPSVNTNSPEFRKCMQEMLTANLERELGGSYEVKAEAVRQKVGRAKISGSVLAGLTIGRAPSTGGRLAAVVILAGSAAYIIDAKSDLYSEYSGKIEDFLRRDNGKNMIDIAGKAMNACAEELKSNPTQMPSPFMPKLYSGPGLRP